MMKIREKNTVGEKGNGASAYLTPLGAVALSFGFAVGWGAFMMPGNIFLPGAGPLGSILGFCIGAACMLVFAWCMHVMTVKSPGTGGPYLFVKNTFGCDHAFLLAWFLFLTYVAILWVNAISLIILVRCLMGDALQFGCHYTLAGFDVYFGEAMLAVAALAAGAVVTLYGKRFAANVQTLLASVLVFGVVTCVAASLVRNGVSLDAMRPAFSPLAGSPRHAQVIAIMALAPWAFVGFEAVTNSSGEFSFPVKKTFAVLASAIAIATFVYMALALLPVIALPGGYATWADYINDLPNLSGVAAVPVLNAARNTLGDFGLTVVVAALVSAQFTGIVAAIIATSRLLRAMARDAIIPKWFGVLNRDRAPQNAIFFIAAISCAIPFLGRAVVGWPLDLSSIGAALVYGYTSAAAFKVAKEQGTGGAWTKALGVIGVALSIVFTLMLLVPNYLSGTIMDTESYLLLALWCVLGFVFYRDVFRKDKESRFGRSIVVWVALTVMIFFSSLMWVRQTMNDMTKAASSQMAERAGGVKILGIEAEKFHDSVLSHFIVEMTLLVVTLGIMLSLYGILRKRERAMAVAMASADELNKSRSYFFSTVSHDIRTPLNAIVGFSQMLKMGVNSREELDQAVDSILVSSKTLLNLINDVLDLSKLESGGMSMALEPTSVQDLLSEIVKTFRVSANKPALEIRLKSESMPTLVIDPMRFRQIAFNLIGNAVKFTVKGHVEVRASFMRGENQDAGTLRIEIEDTGCGIKPEVMQSISSPYVHIDSKVSRHGGTGLGLAITKQLAHAMGGELEVASELGKGSTFTVVLPCKVSAQEPEPAPAPDDDNGVAEEVKPAAPAAPALRRILIVDDQKMNLMVLKAILNKVGGFEVSMAADGKQALKILQDAGDRPFDLVLTDMWMPEMDGAALAAAMHADPKLKDIPVHVITADVETRKEYKILGFRTMLLKPVTMEKIKEILS